MGYDLSSHEGRWSQHFFNFHPDPWRNDPFFWLIFFKGVAQPPPSGIFLSFKGWFPSLKWWDMLVPLRAERFWDVPCRERVRIPPNGKGNSSSQLPLDGRFWFSGGYTLETNSYPLKINGWTMISPFETTYFKRQAVSFRECTYYFGRLVEWLPNSTRWACLKNACLHKKVIISQALGRGSQFRQFKTNENWQCKF